MPTEIKKQIDKIQITRAEKVGNVVVALNKTYLAFKGVCRPVVLNALVIVRMTTRAHLLRLGKYRVITVFETFKREI